MEKVKVYVMCPTKLVTGGPEWLQQLCHELNMYGHIDAKIWYYGKDLEDPQAEIYTKRYNNPYITEQPILYENNWVIVPETLAGKFVEQTRFKDHCHLVILWESVNYYLVSTSSALIGFFAKDTIHLTQGKYTEEYLKFSHIPAENIISLSDYLSKEFLSLGKLQSKRENIIAYNPKKDIGFIEKVKEYAQETNQDFTFMPITDMTTEEVIEALLKSKVFVDFGYAPGTDRMPRESVLCGCCLITSKLGAFKYYEDISIPDKYKFDLELDNIPIIINTIKDLCDNYDIKKNDFIIEKEEILKQKGKFKVGVKNLVDRILEKK